MSSVISIDNLDQKSKDSLKKILAVQGGSDLKDEELEMVINFCRATKLNPFLGQVWVQKRWVKKLNKEVATVQTKIDGLRAIAHNHGLCGIEPTQWSGSGDSLKATVCVLKKLSNAPGDIARFYGEAKFSEYAQRDRDNNITAMWLDRPEIMLEKCAEAKALRRGFSVLSSVEAEDEPAEDLSAVRIAPTHVAHRISAEQKPHRLEEAPTATRAIAQDVEYEEVRDFKREASELLKKYNNEMAKDDPLSFKRAMEKFHGIIVEGMTDSDYELLAKYLHNVVGEL